MPPEAFPLPVQCAAGAKIIQTCFTDSHNTNLIRLLGQDLFVHLEFVWYRMVWMDTGTGEDIFILGNDLEYSR